MNCSLEVIDVMQNNFKGDKIPIWLEPFHKKYSGTGDQKGLYSDWNMMELFLDKAQKAIASIRNDKAQEEITELQRQLFVHAKSKDKSKTTQTFKNIKRIAKGESERLGKAITQVLLFYRFRDNGHRYKNIDDIQEIPGGKQISLPGESPEERVSFLLCQAAWKENEFQKAMNETVVVPLNNATTVKGVCAALGISHEGFTTDKFYNNVELHDKKYRMEGSNGKTLVKTRFGPPKSYERALAKEKEGIAKLGEKWQGLRDLNRVTFEFEDPLILTLVYHALVTKYNVYGLKNKFNKGGNFYAIYDQPPDIHMNLDLDNGWLVEVQLMFSSILDIKKELHTYYDVIRASEPRVIFAPLFEKAPSLVDFKDKEIAELKQLMESNKEVEAMNIKAGIFASPEAEIAHLREELSKLQAWKDDVVKMVNK